MANILTEIKKPLSILFLLAHISAYLIVVHLIIRFVPFKMRNVKGALFAYYSCYLGIALLFITLLLPLIAMKGFADADELMDFVIKFVVLHIFAFLMIWYVYVHNAHFTWGYLVKSLDVEKYAEIMEDEEDEGIVVQESLLELIQGKPSDPDIEVSSNVVGKIVVDSQMFAMTRAIVMGSWISMLGSFILDLQG
jgi:hypothetical protein